MNEEIDTMREVLPAPGRVFSTTATGFASVASTTYSALSVAAYSREPPP